MIVDTKKLNDAISQIDACVDALQAGEMVSEYAEIQCNTLQWALHLIMCGASFKAGDGWTLNTAKLYKAMIEIGGCAGTIHGHPESEEARLEILRWACSVLSEAIKL